MAGLSQRGSRPLRGCLRPTLCWDGRDAPLPVQSVRGVTPTSTLPLGAAGPPWVNTGPPGEPFDFCAHVRRLSTDIVDRCRELRHIRPKQILFAVAQARNGCAHGLQARVTPLRFRDGAVSRRFRGTEYQVQRLVVDQQEMLYVMTFCLPRFQNQTFDDKFITLFHELYHISPSFDGDLRRHTGRCALHTHSQRRYDQHMAELAREYLATRPDPDLHSFLRLSFAQLQARHGCVNGVIVPRPKLVPLSWSELRQAQPEVVHAAVRHP